MNEIAFDEHSVQVGDRQARIYSLGLSLAGTAQALCVPARGPVTTYVASIQEAAGPLVLVADVEGLGLHNEGVSATNAAHRIAVEIGPALARLHGSEVQQLQWVALDSMGQFDRWWWTPDAVEFQPLLPPPGSTAAPRSKQAFYDAYPFAARELMLQVVAAALGDPRSWAQPSLAETH